MEGRQIDAVGSALVPVEHLLDGAVAAGQAHAKDLGCARELASVPALARLPGAARQRALAEERGLAPMLAELAELFLEPATLTPEALVSRPAASG